MRDTFKRLITSTLFTRVCVRACLTINLRHHRNIIYSNKTHISRNHFLQNFQFNGFVSGERARKSVFVIFFIGIGFALTRFDQVKMSMSHHLMMCFFHLCSFNPPSNIPLNFCLPNDIPLVLSYTYLHNGAAA